MKRIMRAPNLALAALALLGALLIGMATATAGEAESGGVAAQVSRAGGGAAPFYAAALVMSVASLSAAYAVGKVGAAALGAAAEKPELLGKAIVFVGLGEGIAIFGLIISLMLINKIP